VSKKVKIVAKAPAGSHKPIVYPAAVLKDSTHQDVARDFLAFTASEDSKMLFAKYGFEVK
jgi:molybdate transport system substrate-binding protein